MARNCAGLHRDPVLFFLKPFGITENKSNGRHMLFRNNQKKKKRLKSKTLVSIKPMLQAPGHAILTCQISVSDSNTSNDPASSLCISIKLSYFVLSIKILHSLFLFFFNQLKVCFQTHSIPLANANYHIWNGQKTRSYYIPKGQYSLSYNKP